MWYTYLKTLHVTCVALSFGGFAARGLLALHAPHLARWRWLRLVPHVNDTLLLASGLTLAHLARFDPLQQPWLLAKLGALILYIGLGAVALSRRPLPRPLRLGAWLAALAVFGFIVGAALSKQPWPWS